MEQSNLKFALLSKILLLGAICAHFGASTIGWNNPNLPGVEFRQAQTAISAYFIQQENDFSLAYPTPVLGKPWSIPMEHPLYQWTTVIWSNVTGTKLTQSGRSVSLLCFYLTLPAIWIFLRRIGLSQPQSVFGLIPVLLCPLHVFYGRAFLIETMALMFSIWFAVGYVETLQRKSWRWLVTVAVCGAAAGAIKITTLILFLIPCAVWSVTELVRTFREGERRQFRQIMTWGLGATVIPGIATILWTRFADSVKAVHPQADVLMSGSMTQFNFGYGLFDVRFSPDTWRAIYTFIETGIVSPLVAGLLLTLGGIWAGRWRLLIFAGASLFALAPMIFPLLYAWHDYYFVASSVFLMLSLGLVFASLLERRWGKVTAICLLVGFGLSQLAVYRGNYHPLQSAVGRNGPKISFTIRDLTLRQDVIMIVGDDWNSMIPYYAQRRALMIRRTYENDLPLIDECLLNLHDESVSLVILMGEQIENQELIDFLERELQISRHHYFAEDNARLFPTGALLESLLPADVLGSKGSSPLNPAYFSTSHRYANKILSASILTARTKTIFQSIVPIPDQFYFQFGPGIVELGTKEVLNAHTLTRMWFDLPAGDHTLRMSGGMMEGAWNRDEHITDGVSISLRRESQPEGTTDLFYHYLNPREISEHRGEQSWSTSFTLNNPTRVVLEVGPGPHGNGGTDWFYFANIQFV